MEFEIQISAAISEVTLFWQIKAVMRVFDGTPDRYMHYMWSPSLGYKFVKSCRKLRQRKVFIQWFCRIQSTHPLFPRHITQQHYIKMCKSHLELRCLLMQNLPICYHACTRTFGPRAISHASQFLEVQVFIHAWFCHYWNGLLFEYILAELH